MSELYGDDYDSVTAGGSGWWFPERLRRAAGALLFIGLIGAMALWAYRLGTRDAGEVPIIRAMEGPARVQPADPGGLRAAHQGLEVNSVLAGQPAPAPDAVAPLALPPVLLAEEDAAQGELILAPQPSFGQDDALVGGELRVPLQDDLGAPEDGLPADAAAPGVGTELALEPDPTLEDAIAAALAAEAEVAPAAAAGPRPLRRPSNLVMARAAAPVASAPAAAAAAVREVASPGAGARLVQLGAYDSEALTRQAWAQLVSRHGDLLGAKSLYVERTTANARVFYRLRVAGFETTSQSGALCEALRARGVDCIPVTLQ